MKIVCALLQVFAAVVLVGLVLGEEEGGDLGTATAGGGEQGCGIPLESGESESDLPKIVLQMTSKCFLSHNRALNDKLDPTHTTEQIQDTFKNFCESTPTFTNCSDSVPAQAQNCVNETVLELVRVDRESFQKLLRVACKNDGKQLVTIFREGAKIKKSNSDQNAEIEKCFRVAHQALDKLPTVSASERRSAISTGIIQFRDCFMAMGEQARIISGAFVRILDDMLA